MPLPCCLWYCACNRWYVPAITGDRQVPDSCCVASMRHETSLYDDRGRQPPLLPEPCCGQFWMRHGLLQKTCTHASLNNQKANGKGKARKECAATVHFMRNKGWEKVIDACLQHPSVRQHQVPGKSWESLCKPWWESFPLAVRMVHRGRLGAALGTRSKSKHGHRP